MAPLSNTHIFLIFLVSSLAAVAAAVSPENYEQSECLTVPNSEFANSLKTTVEAIRNVTSIVSQFSNNTFGDFRLSTAISDCLDLFDSSTDALSWSLSASENSYGIHSSTGDMSSDMRTWLSAALANQDTCMEGFDGTDGFVKNLVAGSIGQVTTLVQQLLSQVQPIQYNPNGGSSTKTTVPAPVKKKQKKTPEFPPWLTVRDRNLIQGSNIVPDFTVALDGSGNFTSIEAAVKAVPDKSSRRYVIYVKRGVYREYVEIKRKKWSIMMVGDGMGNTVISGNRSKAANYTTFRSATFAVGGARFIAKYMTFENTAGPSNYQAVALRSDSDLAVFYRCDFKGYQDTLYTHANRQFFRECRISGTVDFIFGDAAVVFQNCQILAKKGLPNQKNTITAQGRKNATENTGFTIQFCNISADTDLLNFMNLSANSTTYTYLGRPWKLYSHTVVMQSYISDIVRPEGWLEWDGDIGLDSLFYAEYDNYGPGSDHGQRVKWPGYKVINDTSTANKYTVANFIKGDLWIPTTGIQYTSGLAT